MKVVFADDNPSMREIAALSTYLRWRDGPSTNGVNALTTERFSVKMVFIGVDPRVAEIATLATHIRWPDVTPLIATTAAEGLELLEQEAPDVALIHPDFTDMSLHKLIQELRDFSNVPILVLGHQGDEMELITSLSLGADDYVRLPCSLIELMGRMGAILRRRCLSPVHESTELISSGQLSINPASYEVFLGDQRLALSPAEFRLLHLLVRNRGTVVPHSTLERTLRVEHADNSQLVRTSIQRMRQKLGDNSRNPYWIATVHSIGYRFIGPPPDN